MGRVSIGLPMLELLAPVNDKNLPWLEVIHPIVVHFVIDIALLTIAFDVMGVSPERRICLKSATRT